MTRTTRSTGPTHEPHGIIPPFVQRNIEANGTEEQRERARVALAQATVTRTVREERASLTGVTATVEAPADTAKRRTIFDAQNREDLPGEQVRDEGGAATGDADADRVYDGFGATWDLYHDVFGRTSYDDAGATLVGTVNYGVDFANAFWDGTQMVFGDGDRTVFASFTGAIDIMAHELTHAVTEHASGLVYQDQSGALNESLSDVFGSLVKQYAAQPQPTAEEADWLIGEGIWAEGINGIALRSMKAPGTAFDDPTVGTDPQPGHMDDFVITQRDHGGVHINSGIPNKAFYLFAVALGGHSWEVAGRVWYAAATDAAMTPRTDFAAFAAITVTQAAAYGEDVVSAAVEAWAGVGIAVPTPAAEPGVPAEQAHAALVG